MGWLSAPGLEPSHAVTVSTRPCMSKLASERLTAGTLKLWQTATLENMACDTQPARQGTVRWAVGETNSKARCSAQHCAGVRCIESIEPQLASTTGPSRHEQKGGARDEEDNDAVVNLCICQGKSRTDE